MNLNPLCISIAPWLQVCYRNRNLFERDNRLPMTPNILIEILRKIEDSPDYTLNLQQFVSSLVHRFKQDGIVRKFWWPCDWWHSMCWRVIMIYSLNILWIFQLQTLAAISMTTFSNTGEERQFFTIFFCATACLGHTSGISISWLIFIFIFCILIHRTHNSTSGFNFHAHRLLLRSLIPGNANLFPVGRLTQQEQVCWKLSHFRNHRGTYIIFFLIYTYVNHRSLSTW